MQTADSDQPGLLSKLKKKGSNMSDPTILYMFLASARSAQPGAKKSIR